MLTKATALLAVAFFATSFGLAVVAKNKSNALGDVDIPLPMLEQMAVPAGDEREPGTGGREQRHERRTCARSWRVGGCCRRCGLGHRGEPSMSRAPGLLDCRATDRVCHSAPTREMIAPN